MILFPCTGPTPRRWNLPAVGDAEFVPQSAIHPLDHVSNNLRRRVPDTQGAPQIGIIGGQERFIKMLDRVGFVESGEESFCVNAI